MSSPELIETHQDAVATLTLNRPERLNALTPTLVEALLEALPRLGADPAVRAVVLTGAGRGFCAGADIAGLSGRAGGGFEARLQWLRHAHRIPLLLAGLPKVVIGRINGVAAGAGMSLALACDLRVGARSLRFTPAFAGIALSGDYGGSWLLPRLVPPARAREIYLLNQTLDSAEAQALGLLNRLVDDSELDAATQELAARVAAGPTLALGHMKRNLHAGATLSFADALELEAMHTARTAMTDDHREGLQAFAQKRKPAFTGS